jgi:ABC-type glycerol-3-phosphate transport system substrate-binding protein
MRLKKMAQKRFWQCCSATASAALASVCFLQAAPVASATTAAGQTPVTLSWEMWVGGAASIRYWEHDASLVHDQYPWITVKLTNQPSYSDYWLKLPVEISSNTETDLVATQNLRTSSYQSGFLPITASQLVSDGISGFALSDYYKSAVDGYQISSGQFIALPYDVGPLLMYYNATVFNKYHLPLPSNSWTWPTFYKDLATIQKDSGGAIYGYADDPFFDEFLTFATDMGAHYLASNGTLDIATPQFASLLKQYVAPVKEGLAPLPPSNASVTGVWDEQQWEAGAAATYIDGPWDLVNDISAVKEGIENFKIGIAPLPSGPDGKSSTLLSGSGFGISSDLYKNHRGINKAELLSDAIKAIEMMTGPQFENINAADGDFPSRPSAERYFYKTATSLGVPNAASAISYALKDAVPYNATNKWNGTEDAFNSQVVGVMEGSITPQAALKYTQDNQGVPVS